MGLNSAVAACKLCGLSKLWKLSEAQVLHLSNGNNNQHPFMIIITNLAAARVKVMGVEGQGCKRKG